MKCSAPCALIAICFLASCVATDVGNPQTTDALAEVELRAFEEEDPRALTLDDGVEITHIWIAVDEVELAPCEPQVETDPDSDPDSDSDSDDEVEVGPFVADLVSGTTFPESIRLRETMTDFCAFRFNVAPLEPSELPAAAPPELDGRSVLVRGTLKDGQPFIVQATLDESLELEGEVELDPTRLTPFVLGFAVNGWVTQRQLDGLTGNPILIDSDSTPGIYDAFEDAFVSSPRLFAGEIGGPVVAQ